MGEAAPEAERRGKRRVLVVDDNPDAAQMLAILIRDMGHHAEVASNGSAATQAAATFLPDVVLVDVVLPDIDGCDLAADLKTMAALKSARVFAITAYNDDLVRKRAFDSGCDGFFIKPMDPKVLERLLSEDS
jgi:CheY-like chemotaxis protein